MVQTQIVGSVTAQQQRLSSPNGFALRLILCEILFVSEFVNYHKRDVQLPPGCKDLLDVLNKANENRLRTSELLTPSPIETGSLKDLGKKICQLLATPARPSTLGILTPGPSLYLVCRNAPDPFELLLPISREDNEREQTIRSFFRSRKINPAQDLANDETSVRTLLYFLRADAIALVVLLADLLETAYGVSKETSLDFFLDTSFLPPAHSSSAG